MTTRKGEPSKVWFRTDRCFAIGGKWFFATRESQQMGPFLNRDDAVEAVQRYLDALELAERLRKQEIQDNLDQAIDEIDEILKIEAIKSRKKTVVRPPLSVWRGANARREGNR